jgi:hypothetical protein
MGKEDKIEHPAHEEGDLEIETPEDFEDAKLLAGVSTETEALKSAKEHAMNTRDAKLLSEIHNKTHELMQERWAELDEAREQGNEHKIIRIAEEIKILRGLL